MGIHTIKKGLDLPINGKPEQAISEGAAVDRVAVVASDYAYMRPRMFAKVGDQVKRGQPIMEDSKADGVSFVAPAAGEIVAIHRGERRAFISVVVALNEAERNGTTTDADHHTFTSFNAGEMGSDAIRGLLQESGEWTSFRARPHSRVPSPAESCAAIFVTAVDTRPLAPDPDVVINERAEDFARGLDAIATLTEGTVWLCAAAGSKIPRGNASNVSFEEWQGKHPAGLVGTHIHMLDPVHGDKKVWHLNYQDVIAIGALMATGRLDVSRVVSLAGPQVTSPRLLRTRVGAQIAPLTSGQLKDGENRVISGPVLGGRKAMDEASGYLGRYDHQITAVAEDRERVFLGWVRPGSDKFSVIRTFLGGFLPKRTYDFTTTTHGSHRAMVPIGMFERVMPLDILPTFLLRALLVDDVDRAQKLGAMELDEEDLALCSFVSPGKEDYGVALRRNLTDIWKEG